MEESKGIDELKEMHRLQDECWKTYFKDVSVKEGDLINLANQAFNLGFATAWNLKGD